MIGRGLRRRNVLFFFCKNNLRSGPAYVSYAPIGRRPVDLAVSFHTTVTVNGYVMPPSFLARQFGALTINYRTKHAVRGSSTV